MDNTLNNNQKHHKVAGLVGAIGNGNLGDIAILISTFDQLLKAKLFDKIIIFSGNGAETRKYLSSYDSSYFEVAPFLGPELFLNSITQSALIMRIFNNFRSRLTVTPMVPRSRAEDEARHSRKVSILVKVAHLYTFLGALWFGRYIRSFRIKTIEKILGRNVQHRRFLENLKKVDILIFVGGGYLNSNSSASLYPMALTCMIADHYGSKVVFTGQTIWHINIFDRSLFRTLVKKIRDFGLRDKGLSAIELSRIGCNLRSTVEACDQATYLEKDEPGWLHLKESIGLMGNRPYFVLQLHDWAVRGMKGGKVNKGIGGGKRDIAEVLREVAAFCDLVVKDYGFEIVYIPMETEESRDTVLGEAIAKKMSFSNRLHIVETGLHPRILKAIIAGAVAVVNTRYHPMIFAIGENVPSLSICCDNRYYYHKLSGAMALFNIDILEHLLFLDDTTSASLYTAFRNILAKHSWISQETHQRNSEILKETWERIFGVAVSNQETDMNFENGYLELPSRIKKLKDEIFRWIDVVLTLLETRFPEGRSKEIVRNFYQRHMPSRFRKHLNLLYSLNSLIDKAEFLRDGTCFLEFTNGTKLYGLQDYVEDKNLTPIMKHADKRRLGKLKAFVQFASFLQVVSEQYIANTYEKYYHIKKGDIVVDLGANIGVFSIKAANIVGEEGRVIAVEPESNNVRCLRNNVEINRLKNITVVPVGVWSSRGRLNLNLTTHNLGHTLYQTVGAIGSQEIEVKTLGNILEELGVERVDFIKMDVEGAEVEALKGMEGVLIKDDLQCAIEVHRVVSVHRPERIIANFLNMFGFETITHYRPEIIIYAEKRRSSRPQKSK